MSKKIGTLAYTTLAREPLGSRKLAERDDRDAMRGWKAIRKDARKDAFLQMDRNDVDHVHAGSKASRAIHETALRKAIRIKPALKTETGVEDGAALAEVVFLHRSDRALDGKKRIREIVKAGNTPQAGTSFRAILEKRFRF